MNPSRNLGDLGLGRSDNRIRRRRCRLIAGVRLNYCSSRVKSLILGRRLALALGRRQRLRRIPSLYLTLRWRLRLRLRLRYRTLISRTSSRIDLGFRLVPQLGHELP